MRLSKNMKAAINQYYAFKNQHNTGFFSSPAIKEECINALFTAARKAKTRIEITPGVIWLSRGKQKMEIFGPKL